MSAYTNPLSSLITDPVRNFKFLVTFNPVSDTDGKASSWTNKSVGNSFGSMGFVSLSGLSVATEAIAYREGGYNTNVHQIPGQSAFTPITLSKGVMIGQGDNALWMKRLFSVMTPTATAGVGGGFRCNLDIQVLSHPNPQATAGVGGETVANGPDQHTSLRFRVYNAWITSLAYSNLDAGANTLMVEEMSLVHEGFDVSYATDYTKDGSAPVFNDNGTTSTPAPTPSGGGRGPAIQ
jgi:phage tail-like protein